MYHLNNNLREKRRTLENYIYGKFIKHKAKLEDTAGGLFNEVKNYFCQRMMEKSNDYFKNSLNPLTNGRITDQDWQVINLKKNICDLGNEDDASGKK